MVETDRSIKAKSKMLYSMLLEERKQFQAMLKYVAESEAEAIMVHEISRLDRNTQER